MGGGFTNKLFGACMPRMPRKLDKQASQVTQQNFSAPDQKFARGTPVSEVESQKREAAFLKTCGFDKPHDITDTQCLGIVVDRSASMSSMRDELVQGLNVFMDEQRQMGLPCRVSVLDFDNEISTVVDDVEIQHVAPFGDEHFIPRGGTALLDAIGAMVGRMDRRVPAGELSADAAPVIVILTDGEENSSNAFSRERIFELITAKRALGWRFTFMGASQDAISVGRSYGMNADACLEYTPSACIQQNLWQMSSQQVARSRRGECESFSVAERDSCVMR